MAVITLLGYMGSGKSTYGSLLAEKLGYSFVDLDDYIVDELKMSIAEIFQAKGEKWFREYESESLNKLIKSDGNILLSLGGGTPVYNNNMELINRYSKSIYLNASVDTLYEYLKNARSKRPIIKDLSDVELYEFILKHLGKRREYYKMAKSSVITDKKTIEQIVDELEQIVLANHDLH
ncbi:MAG: shikimate kinase [Bacteroidota bacterium]